MLAAASSTGACGNIGRERLLPKPEPMEIHADSTTLSKGDQSRLANVRRFLDPYEAGLLETSLHQLEEDTRLPEGASDEALKRALSGFSQAEGFCDRFVEELQPLTLQGPDATAPERVATAVSIDDAYDKWLTNSARDQFDQPIELARALRDGVVGPEVFNRSAPLGRPDRPLFLTDAAEFDKKGPSAAGRLCLPGKPAQSYVLAIVPVSALAGPLRVPTAADGACRARFTLTPADATVGETCTGRPEYVTNPVTLAAVEEFRLSR